MAKRPWLYGAVVLVLGFEIATIVAVANSNVTDEYRAFYIDRSSDCWPATVPGEWRLATTLSLTRQRNPWHRAASNLLVCGWIGPDAGGSWSSGPEARLRLKPKLAPGSGLALELELLPYAFESHPQQRAVFAVNGTQVAELDLSAASQSQQRIVIPPDIVGAAPDGALEVSIELPDAISPRELGRTPERRKLAIRLLSIRLDPIPPK